MIKKFIHLFLAVSVFLSSAGIWVNSHFCQEKYVGSSLFFSLGSCCSNMDSSPCSMETMSCKHGKKDQNEKNCCQNKKQYYKLDQTQEIQTLELKDFGFSKKLIALVPFTPKFETTTFQTKHFPQNYSPPFIVYDRRVRFQTFLC